PTTATCRNCTGGNCTDNILPEVLQQKQLTSGYFSLFSSSKPTGKCSHGGSFDKTSQHDPTGGINKDDASESHGYLHLQAAEVAVNATMEILEDIRLAIGDKNFLRLMGMSQSAVLCFVIDTTGSMADDIAEAKRVSFSIIDLKRGSQEEPSEYILVPFNDPGVGPLIRTTDADVFKQEINKLTASGGGDIPEMCLSGLLLALTAAPPSSDIFVFTDAPAKDAVLKSILTALIEATKSKVTLLQAMRTSAGSQSFSFLLDESVFNVTVYITGASPVFSLYSPTGDSQSNEMSDGPLGTITKVGNLQRIQVNTSNRTGLWSITINTTETFVVKVTGQSSINFLFHLVEAHEGAHGDFSLKQSRPSVGKSFTMLMSVTGGDSPSITEVQLEPASSGAAAVNGTVEAIGGGDFLVTFSEPPEGEFSVRVKGESAAAAAAAASGDRASSRSATSQFQRQASTQLKASRVTVKAAANGTIEPGATVTVPFTVETNTTAGTYTIQARNDREFTMTSPSSLTLKTGEKAEGTVTLTVPSSTASGTDVTLTIEAQAPGDTDSNYVVLSFAVAARVTDLTRPECQVSVTANCSLDCTQDTWELSANMTDGNGTGISSVTLQQGNGTLNTTTTGGGGSSGVGITFATYSASCCSQEVELLMVDEVGNTAVCSASIRDTSSGAGLHHPAASCWLWPMLVLILCRLWT
ncbi:von Willebrand factor A domain-containing protein 7-like, partial [Engraulis encrasicolus]|uniref:von Willebrand factor A domain-containing protein 7-like n=1 Tax=Engraulis encrasicolus TaxID=184585 RepID=UPI002FD6A189